MSRSRYLFGNRTRNVVVRAVGHRVHDLAGRGSGLKINVLVCRSILGRIVFPSLGLFRSCRLVLGRILVLGIILGRLVFLHLPCSIRGISGLFCLFALIFLRGNSHGLRSLFVNLGSFVSCCQLTELVDGIADRNLAHYQRHCYQAGDEPLGVTSGEALQFRLHVRPLSLGTAPIPCCFSFSRAG